MVRPSPQASTGIASPETWDSRIAEATPASEAHSAGRGECYVSMEDRASATGDATRGLDQATPSSDAELRPEPSTLFAIADEVIELQAMSGPGATRTLRNVRCDLARQGDLRSL